MWVILILVFAAWMASRARDQRNKDILDQKARVKERVNAAYERRAGKKAVNDVDYLEYQDTLKNLDSEEL